MGNALKCLFAAPAVLFPNAGAGVTIESQGVSHRVVIAQDAIAQAPRIDHQQNPAAVQIGTSITVDWPEEASYDEDDEDDDLYHDDADELADWSAPTSSSTRTWAWKWTGTPSVARDPTASRSGTPATHERHWYSEQQLADLIAAHVHLERQGDSPPWSVRKFVQNFDGLTRTATAKDVLAKAGLSGKMLADLATADGIDAESVVALLGQMKTHSRSRRRRRWGGSARITPQSQ